MRKGAIRKHPYPTQKYVVEWFKYETIPDAFLTWRKGKGSGGTAGWAGSTTVDHKDKNHSRRIKIDGVQYAQQDLIWIYHRGVMPEGGLKFLDGNRWNHAIENLAPAVAPLEPVVSFF